MVTIHQLKKQRKARFMKEAALLADNYSKVIENNVSSNFTKFANECFNLVNDYTCDCTKLKCDCGKPSIGFTGLTTTPQHPICKKCLKAYEDGGEVNG